MSTESNRPEYNKRKPYDSMKHCGHAMNRNPDDLRERIEKYQRRLDDLAAIREAAGGELSIFQRKQFKQNLTRMGFAKKSLQKIEDLGPDDRPCVKGKGQATDHPGVGLCSFHCECKGKDGGHLTMYRSRKAKDKKLQDLIDEMEQSGHDILDLTPDVLLLRAKVKMFIDEKIDFDPETVRSLTLLMDQIRKSVETINDKKFKSMITMETFNVLMFRMSEAMMKHVTDPEVLDKIVLDWQRISVDTTANKRGQQQIGGRVDNGSI